MQIAIPVFLQKYLQNGKEDDIIIANNEELKKFAEVKENMKSDNVF